LSNLKFEEEELLIQRLEIAKGDLQQSIEKEVRDNLILQEKETGFAKAALGI